MTRRDLHWRARHWREETLAFDGAIRPVGKAFRAWDRHLAQLRRRDPVLCEAVYETMRLDRERAEKMGYDWWKAQFPRRWSRIQKILETGRQAYLCKWSASARGHSPSP